MTSSEFNANFDANAEVFSKTVADCLDDVSGGSITSDDVTITSVIDASVARLRHLTSGGSVTVSYTIAYNIAVFGYTGEPNDAFAILVNALGEAVNGTTFTTYLQANGANSDLSGASAQSGSLHSSGYAAAGNDDTGGSDDGINLGIVAGIPVAVGGFMLLVGIVVCILRSRRSAAVYTS